MSEKPNPTRKRLVDAATKLFYAEGIGRVSVFPGGQLLLAGSNSLGVAPLRVMSRANAMGEVSLNSAFDPSSILTPTTFASAYGTQLGLALPYFNTALNLATIGDGRSFLASGLKMNNEAAYLAATLGAGAPDLFTSLANQPVYRIVGGGWGGESY